MMSNKLRTTLYIGVTSHLERRVLEHKSGKGSDFTTRYKLTDLVYYEEFSNIQDAIRREKQLKNWHKKWKWNLINTHNPELKDLALDWFSASEIKSYKDAETSSA